MKRTIRVEDEFYILATPTALETQNRVLKSNELFAIFDSQGNIRPWGLETHGIYYEGTRFLSRLVMSIEEKQPLFLSSTVEKHHNILAIDLTNPDIQVNGGVQLKRGTIHLFKYIFLNDQCCYQRIRIANYGLEQVQFKLAFEFEADYSDIFEVRGLTREKRGVMHEPHSDSQQTVLTYEGLDNICRKTQVKFYPSPSVIDAHHASFIIKLAPHQSTDIYLTISSQSTESLNSNESYELAYQQIKKKYDALRDNHGHVETSNKQFNNWLERSRTDFFMMLTETPSGLYPYAGIPWFSVVFGRDGIITALETLWLCPDVGRSVLAYLANHQAQEINPDQDAEPGKIVHEERKGEMANLKEIPFGRYYGSVDSTLLFLVLAGYYFTRTGDRAFIERIWPSIEAALNWTYEYGDPDGDGFIEYERKAMGGGLTQQGWKDSDDSIFHADGEIARAPIALCEVQGYNYEAKIQIAELAKHLGKKDLSTRLLREAKELKKNFQKKFWCDDINAYALALDGDKKPCRVRSSNAGQCLFSGIASRSEARRITSLMVGESFFSGWGIRTVASSEIRYNPMSYHNGSIWPHDNALIASGMRRYGFGKEALKVLNGLFDASLSMDSYRLPELFCGFPRRSDEGPTLYPVACNPQSWASGSIFMLLQACLGLQIDGVEQKISFVNPVLPDFLDEVRLYNLQVGSGSVDVLLQRKMGKIKVKVIRQQGKLKVVTVK